MILFELTHNLFSLCKTGACLAEHKADAQVVLEGRNILKIFLNTLFSFNSCCRLVELYLIVLIIKGTL